MRVNSRRSDATCIGCAPANNSRNSAYRIAELPKSEFDDKAAKQRVELPILFRTRRCLLSDKPEGYRSSRWEWRQLLGDRGSRVASAHRPSFLNRHRLDRETSGILLVGKKRLALTALHDMFREHGAGGTSATLYWSRVAG